MLFFIAFYDNHNTYLQDLWMEKAVRELSFEGHVRELLDEDMQGPATIDGLSTSQYSNS
jgi:hypothetical protein